MCGLIRIPKEISSVIFNLNGNCCLFFIYWNDTIHNELLIVFVVDDLLGLRMSKAIRCFLSKVTGYLSILQRNKRKIRLRKNLREKKIQNYFNNSRRLSSYFIFTGLFLCESKVFVCGRNVDSSQNSSYGERNNKNT